MYRLCFVFFFGTLFVQAQSTLPCEKVVKFKKLLDAQHISPQKWDELFGIRVTNQLFSLIDPKSRYFLQHEKDQFIADAAKLAKSLSEGDCSIIKRLAPIYKDAYVRSERILEAINKETLNFNTPDTVKFNLLEQPLVVNETQLRNRWIQTIKLNVLMEFSASTNDVKQSNANYKSAQDRACKKFLNAIKRKLALSVGFEFDLQDRLLDAIATSYDPHSAYLSVNVFQLLIDALSTEYLSYGIVLNDDQSGNVIIDRIIPGSSAWDVHNLHVGDVVTALDAGKEKVDATLYTSEELEEMLSTASKEVALSVRKADGDEATVKLVKQRVREDDNKIKSLIISNAKHRYGYVDLPVFFTKNETTNSGCAIDLAKEIIQLKKAKIDGLILDLRNNGGGDLEEAIDLAGIFIDRGALTILKRRNAEAETLRDNNPGTAYDGPLLIMINGGSASASELFAGAMRAHNRAILVGGTTFGKATGQSIIPLKETKEAVKITTFRFYDVKGKSHQGKGINPDIVLPDLFNSERYAENQKRFFMSADGIEKKTYYTPLAPLPLVALRDSAQQRVKTSLYFQDVNSRRAHMTKFIRNNVLTFPLSLAGVRNVDPADNEILKSRKPVGEKYAIKLTSFDQQVNSIDDFGAATFNILIENVSHDYYIDESLNILTDYIKLKNND